MEPRAEKVCKKYMDELLMTEGELRVVIGVSGGADSICLLFLMKDILPADNIRVIHINHMIRGNEADEDSGFVEEICRREGLFFKEIRKDIPALSREMGYTEEEAGRRIRYECFGKEAEDFKEFWLPIMKKNPYNVISFQTDRYTDAAGLSINPQPDTVIRVFMTYYASDRAVEIPAQELSAPERSGFTVVEWGGSMVK